MTYYLEEHEMNFFNLLFFMPCLSIFWCYTGNVCAHSRGNVQVGTKGDLYGHDSDLSQQI